MAERAAASPPANPGFPQVDVPVAGLVSMASLDELRAARYAEQAETDRLVWEAAELERVAEDRRADAGALLVPRRAWWPVPTELSPWLDRAELLAVRVSRLDYRIARLESRSRLLAALVGPVLRRERRRSAARLRESLLNVVEFGGQEGAHVPDVEPLLEEAFQLEAQAGTLRADLALRSQRLEALDREIGLRTEAVQRMQFDSLHLAAYFSAHGLPGIDAPVELEADEVAYLAVPAELARAPAGKTLVGSGGGSNPPAELTGIRHWIGLFHDGSAPRQALHHVDAGTLVVTSRQLAFAGSREWVTIPLAGVVDVHVYHDAVAVVLLERESLDFFLLEVPKLLVFYLNWAIRLGL
ncbi:MAG TPA: hypothetical protein VKF59_11850 [Candidatus Dormibacteraeota bacterium]|nr:hypothetical protein [Candidatus Dormibacteraeota bacterium]